MQCRLVAFLSVLIASCWFAASGVPRTYCNSQHRNIQSDWRLHCIVPGWMGSWIPRCCTWKTRMPEISSFWRCLSRDFRCIFYSNISPFLSNLWVKISSHGGEVWRNDYLCSGSWLLMLVLVVAAPRPSLNMAWHETVQHRGRGHVHRRQPYGLCSWTWGSKRLSLQT